MRRRRFNQQRKSLSIEESAEILRLRESGKSIEQIAVETGRSYSLVYGVCTGRHKIFGDGYFKLVKGCEVEPTRVTQRRLPKKQWSNRVRITPFLVWKRWSYGDDTNVVFYINRNGIFEMYGENSKIDWRKRRQYAEIVYGILKRMGAVR